MRTKKEWLDWYDKLKDDKISNLLSLNKNDYIIKTSTNLDKKISTIIEINCSKYKIKTDLKREKKESKSIFSIPLLKYGFALSSLLIIFLSVFFIIKLFIPAQNSCIVSSINGDVFSIKENKYKKRIKLNDNLKEKELISTKKNSEMKINIGNSTVTINENSELILSKLYKKKNTEKTNLYLNTGNFYFDLAKMDKDSFFQVETENILLSTIGTKFLINVTNIKDIVVVLNEGQLSIVIKFKNYNLSYIKKINKNFAKEIEATICDKIILNENEKIEISYNKFKEAEDEIAKIINSFSDELKKNKGSKDRINEIIKNAKVKIFEITEIKKNILNKKHISSKDNITEIEKDLFLIEKLPYTNNIELTEKNTYITNDNTNIYITSESNNQIYCIDCKTGKIKWKFSDEKMNGLTSPATSFDDIIVLSNPDNIFILNKKGEIKTSIKLEKGVNYWASPLKANNKIIIPASQNIYYYDGDSIKIIKEFGNSLGQIYASYYNNKLFCLDSNDQKIKIFDLIENKIIWTSSQIENRIFCYPSVIENNIYVSDFKNNFYKFGFKNDKTSPEIIKMGIGTVSNLVYNKNYIYFIANNGYFYSINLLKFNYAKKITSVDLNPNNNKYLTKKLLNDSDDIYFSSDTGKVFYYDCSENNFKFIEIENNKDNNPLIGSPIKINNGIYFIDSKFNIYKLLKNK